MSKQDDIRPQLVVYSLDELLELEIPKRQYLLSPWLQSQGLCMIYSTRGFGKTWIALEIAYTVASGGQFLSWESENPAGVLYIDGDMALIELQERASQIDMRESKELKAPLRFLTRDAQECDFPDLSTFDGQKQIETLISEFQTPGYHSVNWNADNLPSGVYLIRMDSGDFTQTQKVVLVK